MFALWAPTYAINATALRHDCILRLAQGAVQV